MTPQHVDIGQAHGYDNTHSCGLASTHGHCNKNKTQAFQQTSDRTTSTHTADDDA